MENTEYPFVSVECLLYLTNTYSQNSESRVLEETVWKEVWLWVNDRLRGFLFYWDLSIFLWEFQQIRAWVPITALWLWTSCLMPCHLLCTTIYLFVEMRLIIPTRVNLNINEITNAENIACGRWSVNGFLSSFSFLGSRREPLCNLLLSSNAPHSVGGRSVSYEGFIGKHF